MESIAKTLGSGSGIDISALVTSLVEASTAVKAAALSQRAETLTAQISGVSRLKGGITGFATALSTLTKGGTLSTQPSSSNTGIVGVAKSGGNSLDGLSVGIEVRQIASAQVSSSAPISLATDPIGTGKLTITLGTSTVSSGTMTGFTAGSATPIEIDITPDNNSLNGIAAAINAADAGVTATILTDGAGARLVLKGTAGESRAFTMTATEDVGAEGLAALDVGVGSTLGSAAQDTIVAVDGIAVKRTTATIYDLVPGVRLDLLKAAPGEIVRIGGSRPTEALRQAVVDVVDTFNEVQSIVREATNPVDGPLKSDTGARALSRALGGLTLTTLITDAEPGEPTTLSAIGVTTNRDGTLSLDTAKLTKALSDHPDLVERMFAPNSGLSAALDKISAAATSTTSGLGASEARYTASQRTLSADQTRATQQIEALRTRMTQQFAAMDAKVAAYKATQTALQNQIDAWNQKS